MTMSSVPPPVFHRDPSRDGVINRVQGFFLTRFGWFWRLIARWPWAAKWLNHRLIHAACKRAPRRPYPLSTMHASDFTSWDSLSDKTWNGRHLPPMPRDEVADLPTLRKVAELFVRPAGGFVECPKSTTLFPAFAQWLTDGFLRTESTDFNRNHSAHQIDASQLYGERPGVTRQLRTLVGGRLKTQSINGEEYAPYLFKTGIRPRVKNDGLNDVPDPLRFDDRFPLERQDALFAFGGERANTTPQTAMINTLFLREHNRIAAELAAAESSWDDERLFQTARNVVIVLVIKIAVEDYINHISPFRFRLRADPSVAWTAAWNKPNWMTAEFNLLYRWHSLVPDAAAWPTGEVAGVEGIYNNRLLTEVGLGRAVAACSAQPAGRIGLFNTPRFLLPTEEASVRQGREVRLRSYNDYRELVGYPRVDRFEQITGDPTRLAALKELYGDVNRVEFYVGLFAEDSRPTAAVPALIGRLVALDALSQAFANPLLAELMFNDQTFGKAGMAIIGVTSSLQDLVNRNTTGGPYAATFTRSNRGPKPTIFGPPI